jgi:2-polyprenyl-3-methyl-5-hydroxy-6-metoxy-1,4-benzoquinol methylase
MVETAQITMCPVCGNETAPDDVELGGYQLYRCPRCTLRFAPQAFNVSVDYDRVYQSPEYESDQVSMLKSLDRRRLAEHPTYRSFFSQVSHASGARLLDVGCGVGRFAQAAYGRGWDVTGIDVSARAIESGRPFAPFRLRVATVEELVEQGEQFQVVTAFEVLEHLTSPVKFLSTLRRLVSPGGQVFCTVPNWGSAEVRNSTRPDWLPPIHLLFFSPASLEAAAKQSGLVRVKTGVIRSDPIPRGALPRARWLARRLLRRRREPLGLWVQGWGAA